MVNKVHLLTNQYNLESDEIHYHTDVLQGDCLSLFLFILSVNPLSFLLITLNSYQIGKPDSKRTNHKKSKTTIRLNKNILKG